MNVKIEEKPAFKLFGVERIISMEDGKNFIEIPAFWQESFANGTVDRLEQASGIEVSDDYEGMLPVHAVMSYKETGSNTFPYLIGCFLNDTHTVKDYTVAEIPASKWAVFTTEMYTMETLTASVQGLWQKIYSEWFPTSGYKMTEGANLEVYCKGSGVDEFCEIWIPIK